MKVTLSSHLYFLKFHLAPQGEIYHPNFLVQMSSGLHERSPFPIQDILDRTFSDFPPHLVFHAHRSTAAVKYMKNIK